MAGFHPPRLQVDLVKIESNRWHITAKLKRHYHASWEHVGGAAVSGPRGAAVREARRIAADLAAEMGIDPKWIDVVT